MNEQWYKEWKKDRKKVRTYREWQKAGRHVRKGERAIGRNRKGATFHLDQTDATFNLDIDPEAGYEEDAFFCQLDSYFDDIGDR